MIEFFKHLWHGFWSFGWELYKDKPLLHADRMYYDGWHYVIHLGPFWVECDEFEIV